MEVEADVTNGIPAFVIVGLPDRACAEATAARAQRDHVGRARVPGRPRHGQSRSGRAAEGGLGLRPADRARGPRGVAAAAARRARPARVGRRARARRAPAPSRRRARGRRGRDGAWASSASSARWSPPRRPRSRESSRSRFRHLADTVAYLRGELEPDPLPPSRPHALEAPQPDLGRRARPGARAARARARRRRAVTTSCSPGRRARGRRCSRAASRASCRRSTPTRRSR